MKAKIVYIQLIICMLCNYIFIYSQPFPAKYNFEKLSIEHGLSSTAVYSILQDKKGFLWFGTENGLNRYDGYSFKIFKNESGNENSIADNFIWNMCEDNIGNIWFATENGLDKYIPSTDKFIHYLSNQNDSNSVSGNSISIISRRCK